jgi:hypothetical protein
MILISRWKTAAGAAFAAMTALALAACIVSPGKFDAKLDLRRDGTFSFSYTGEIYLLALSKLAEMSAAEAEQYVETPCYDDETFEERPCTEEELAEQRATWEQQAESRRQNSQREAEQMRQFLGGIDPSDPAAAEELAARLRRQEGWKRVEYRGDGLFDVEFALSGRLGHDFTFPTLERFPIQNSFVVANVRQGGSVRIEAPGFSGQTGNPYQSMMMAGMASSAAIATGAQDPAAGPQLPEMDGTFRIVTDGRILANNTDEGPAAGAGGQVLEWKVNRRTQAAPMALIQLGS